MLKRLLRENGIPWPSPYRSPDAASHAGTSSGQSLPHLPVEVILKVLFYAMTSRRPIIDPLCKPAKENRTTGENGRANQIAIHFLATCRAYHSEGRKYLWSNNSFIFTSVRAIKAFADVDLVYREKVRSINIRVVARYYDDEDRAHRLPRDYHHQMSSSIKLKVNKRPLEPTLARRGFRVYGWFQLIDSLEALLPPHDPSHDRSLPRKRLLPNLEKLRIDLVNFGVDLLQFPPAPLHDIASHHLGCSLNELTITGLPRDDAGYRVGSELTGLLKDDGLFIDHDPTFVALKTHLRNLSGNHMHMKVVRSMRPAQGVKHHHHDDHPGYFTEFTPAPIDEGEPPFSPYLSCRTIWKKVPKSIDSPHIRRWVLFDRVTGVEWDDIESEATMYDFLDDSEDEDGGMMCENCGEVHPGAILPDDLMDELYDEFGG
jgi:hypothetical protein